MCCQLMITLNSNICHRSLFLTFNITVYNLRKFVIFYFISTSGGFTGHMEKHAKLFRFQCSNCRRRFSNRQEKRCNSIQYKCFISSKKFYQYMRPKHTGEKPFECSDCPKRLNHNSNHTRHYQMSTQADELNHFQYLLTLIVIWWEETQTTADFYRFFFSS